MNGDRSLVSETTSDVERRPSPGRVAVVLTGLALGVLLMGIQLWLLTIALDRYLAGHGYLAARGHIRPGLPRGPASAAHAGSPSTLNASARRLTLASAPMRVAEQSHLGGEAQTRFTEQN